MKRITGCLILLAVLTVPGWSIGTEPWNQEQPCFSEIEEGCHPEAWSNCRERALHVYLHRLNECSGLQGEALDNCHGAAANLYWLDRAHCP